MFVALVLNFLVAFLVLVYHSIRKDMRRGVVRTVLILSAPVVSIAFMVMAQVYNFLFYRRESMTLSIEELSMSLDRVEEVVDVDVQKESDKIPLKEAMLISDHKSRRKVLLEVLKREKDASVLQLIKDATLDDDSEVSHYAIAFVTDKLTEYRNMEEDSSKLLEEYPTVENRIKYIECLCEILKPRFFTEFEQERYTFNLDEQIGILRAESRQEVTGFILKDIIGLWEELENNDKIVEYVEFARDIALTDLEATKLCLKYYYKNSLREEFAKLLNEVKGSTIDIDSEVLDWIRFYNNV